MVSAEASGADRSAPAPALGCPVDAIPAGRFAAGAQPLAQGGARGTGGTCSGEPSKSLASAALLQPLSSFRREAFASLAALEKILPFRLGYVLPAPVEALPSVAGIAIDVAVTACVDIAAPTLANEALPVRTCSSAAPSRRLRCPEPSPVPIRIRA